MSTITVALDTRGPVWDTEEAAMFAGQHGLRPAEGRQEWRTRDGAVLMVLDRHWTEFTAHRPDSRPVAVALAVAFWERLGGLLSADQDLRSSLVLMLARGVDAEQA